MASRTRATPKGNSGRKIKGRSVGSHHANNIDKTHAKKKAKKESKRVRASLEEVREHQRQIDAKARTPEAISERVEASGHRGHSQCTRTNCTWYQPTCPVVNSTIEIVELPDEIFPDYIADALRLPVMAKDAQGTDFTMGEARLRFRRGYHISHVMRTTGWGFNYFDDLVSEDGYVREDERL